MKNKLFVILLMFLAVNSYGQQFSSDFKSIQVNKKLRDFPDKFNLSSPLNACITLINIVVNGKDGLLRSVSTVLNETPEPTAPDSKFNEQEKERILNATIKEVVVFKDSVACCIIELGKSDFSLRVFLLENGKWVNRCEDGRMSLKESYRYCSKFANYFHHELPSFNARAIVPTDTASFVNYIVEKGVNPKEFVLDKLNKNKLVIYGEIHCRKASWDLLGEVVCDKRFTENTGVVFLEMGSDEQADIDKFLANDTIDKELLLDVFREYIFEGWNDKGRFDFMIEIWKLNKKLPANKQIKIIAVDTPRPFSTFHSKADMIKNDEMAGDRDEYMANAVLSYLKSTKDARNALFIVGTGHVCKTLESAGKKLSQKMPNDTYTIFAHAPQTENFNIVSDKIRYGMFDYAFYKSGNQPIAFDLKNSPFGKEPFDGLHNDGFGLYQDNYDGYLFFGPLDKEPKGEILLDLYSEKFVLELDRRCQFYGDSLVGVWGLKELSKKAVIEKVLKDNKSKTRWE